MIHTSNAQVGHISLDGEIVYKVSDISIKIAVDLSGMNTALNELNAKLGIPPTGTIIEGSIVEPVTDPARLLPSKEVSE